MAGFAVVDVETTGFGRSHRVVEIGVVLCRPDGSVESEWTTLVNAKRDLGAARIHGITARDMARAPEFADIADAVMHLLAGRVIVAHNAEFDMRFIGAELERSGRALPATQLPILCTLQWARRMQWPGSLVECCDALGIPLRNAHNALADAHATAGLLQLLVQSVGSHPHWQHETAGAEHVRWSLAPLNGPPPQFLRTVAPPPWAWIDSVVAAVPVPSEPVHEGRYLICLRSALLDLHISESETAELAAAASEVGLTRTRIMELHRDCLMAMADEALADDVLTDSERRDLEQAALVLNLSPDDVTHALTCAAERRAVRRDADSHPDPGQHAGKLFPGDRVVFTGEMKRLRSDWITEITAAGLTTGSITKSTRLVVAADPDSLSGKAEKARKYGVPVITEGGFESLFAAYKAADLELTPVLEGQR